MSAISMAASAGQKIYTITQDVYSRNPNIVSLNLASHSETTKDKVQQALAAGYDVMIHEVPISQDGWSGAGYNMIDPNTGAGGYLIDGGANGGALVSAIGTAIAMLGIIASVSPFFLGVAYLVGSAMALAITLIAIWSLVLYELYALDIPAGSSRSIVANLAWGAFGVSVSVFTGSYVVAFLAWVLGAIGNTYISLSSPNDQDFQYA